MAAVDMMNSNIKLQWPLCQSMDSILWKVQSCHHSLVVFDRVMKNRHKSFPLVKDTSKHSNTHTARSFMLWVISGGACPPCMVAFG